MKKILSLFLVLVTLVAGLFGGCADTITEEDRQGSLLIEVHSAGYGTDWIDFMAKEYQQKTGKKVIVTYQIGTQGITNMGANLKSLTSDTDIFFMGGADFADVYRGQVVVNGESFPCIFEDLTDLYKSTIEGEDITVEDKMLEKAKSSLITSEGKYYHFPYVAGMQGFIRNLDVWDASWTVPRTTDELFELCKKIKATGKAPFIYSLGDEYWSSMLPVFISQYEGKENMDKLYSGYGPDGRRYSDNMIAYTGLLEGLEFFHELLVESNGYMHKDSKDTSFTNMQSMFLEGEAVFNCNGDWLEREMFANYPDASIEMFKLPILSAVADKCSFGADADKENKLRELIDYVDGVTATKPAFASDADVAYVKEARSFERAGSGNCGVIPCYSNQKDAAKDFLKFMASNTGLKIFRDNTNGCRIPFDYSGVEAPASETVFRKSVNKVMAQSTLNGGARVRDKIYTIGEINPYFFNNKFGRFVGVFAATNPVDYKTPMEYYLEEVKTVNSSLSTAKIKAGIN